jgi:rhodanese-related sulfurtransferase
MQQMKKSLFFFLVVVCGCSQTQKNETTPLASATSSLLEPKVFKEKLSLEPNAILIDVRTPAEAAEGIIPGAIVMDFNGSDFNSKISELDKGKTYLVYCQVGGRSAKATARMEQDSFKAVYNLKGGYSAWVDNGFETTKP